MTRRWIAALFAMAAGWAPAAQQQFRATVDAVAVDVSVKNGNTPVLGLTVADFTLLDNGVPQRIDAVSIESLPIDVTLLLDVSGSTQGTLLPRLKAAVTESAALLTPRDTIRLLTFSNAVQEAFDFKPSESLPNLSRLAAGGGTSFHEGLIAAMIKSRPTERRHLIIAFTDGTDTSSFLGYDAARDVALRSDAVVHVVLGRDPVGFGWLGPSNQDVAVLTALTGGGSTEFSRTGTAPIGKVFTKVIEDFRTSYVLRYTLSGVPRAGWHDITVRLNRSGTFVIRAKKGYAGALPD